MANVTSTKIFRHMHTKIQIEGKTVNSVITKQSSTYRSAVKRTLSFHFFVREKIAAFVKFRDAIHFYIQPDTARSCGGWRRHDANRRRQKTKNDDKQLLLTSTRTWRRGNRRSLTQLRPRGDTQTRPNTKILIRGRRIKGSGDFAAGFRGLWAKPLEKWDLEL